MPIICPQCNKDDMIQKVKAVYSGGVSSGQYSGTSVGIGISTKDGTPTVVSGNTNIAGTSQTLLSRRLSPPPQPSIMGNLRPPIIAVLVLVMVVDCAIVFQTGMLYGSMNNGFFTYAEISSDEISKKMRLWKGYGSITQYLTSPLP